MSTQSIDQKRELLARRLRNQSRQTVHPLSHNQKALWFMNQLAPDSWAYITLFTARIISAVDLSALERAFTALARRHAILRTTYHVQNGEPVQRVGSEPRVDLAVVDAATWSDQDLQERISREAHRPFDLERGPVFRVAMFHLASGEFILLFAVHHIAVDYWSQSILLEELGVLYAAECGTTQVSLPPLKAQYTDFVRWQADLLQSAQGEQQQGFWLEKLGGELAVLNLPTDHQAPPVRTYRGATFTFQVESRLSDQLEAFAKAEGVTLFVMLLAAYQVMLHRYSGQDDIVVGTPTAGRSRAEFEGAAGYFANPVVLRGDFSGAPSFRALLRQLRTTTSEAIAHADYPFPLLVDHVQPQRDSSRSPLFQALFALQRAPRLEQQDLSAFFMGDGQISLNLGGLIMKSFPMQQQEGQFELKLYMAKSPNGLLGALQYSTDLFDESTIARMAGHFLNLLEAVVANPDQEVAALPFLLEGERRQLLTQWNDGTRRYPPSHSLIDLFEARVGQVPDGVALVYEQQQLTYQELNCRANQVAHFLRKQGVGPEVLVGICLPRSLELVIGILGILKAGGAYLPLDPAYPKERLAFILEDAGVSFLVAQGELAADLPDRAASVVCLDTDREAILRESRENPKISVPPDNLAYVIYTSGSTGKPKGALITHHNVVRLFQATDADFHFNQDDVWTLFHSHAFDFSVWELWGALLHGGRLVVVPYWVSRSPEAFYDLLCAEHVTVLNQTPSAFRQLTRAEEERATTGQLSLRLVIFGGEALEFQSLRPWFDRHGDRFPQLVNMYGITETTVHVTYRPLTAADAVGGRGSVIGRPLADLQVYVLDQHLQPAPISVAGEMYVGGAGLARGYLNRPQLTAERFIANPFSPGERLYKTGDLARHLPDGQLEYLGRIDDQVKIRGFRIELGEIEAALCGHTAIREALVLVKADGGHAKSLVAYLVPSANQTPTVDELRTHLKAQLPDYMVPAAYILLPAFPLTNNGKVDRRALPSPDHERPELAAAYVAPRTPNEELIAGIWAQVLGVARVGVHDDFFALGGHSLLATQVVSRLRERLGVEVPLQILFQATTLAALAAEVERYGRSGRGRSAPPIMPVARDGELPLSHAQERLWLVDQLEPGTATYSLPAALRLHGALQVTALEQALNEVVRRHESLRTVFAIHDGKPVQVITPFEPATLIVADVAADPADPEAVQRLIRAEAVRPFDLATGPLLRTHLLRLAESEHVLLVTMHHIVADGWSVGLLIREVTALYAAFAAGEPSPLAELTVQYADFAVAQRAWLKGELSDEQLAYWRQQLGGVQTLSLPTDRPRPSVPLHRGATQRLTLPPALTDRLTGLSRQAGVTLFMTLLAAFQALLSRYSGQDDIAVGSPIANRNRVESEKMIGCFVNTLVLRTDLSGNPGFRELLGRVRDVTIGAYAHQDVPFEQLVDALQPERNLSYSPLFQVAFALDNTPPATIALQGLAVVPIAADTETAKFDLSLSLAESDGALSGTLEYATQLFDEATAARMVGHYQMLLEGIAADPDQPLSDLPLLTEAEQHQLLVAWNETAEVYPRDRCIHELVAQHAQRTPAAVAVVDGAHQLTYGELDTQANQLAHYLRRLGVGPDVLVGICAERSAEMVAGLLAIAKAGGAYLPLDPAYPEERLAFMLADAGVTVLLTQEGLRGRFPESLVRLVCLDGDRDRAVVAQERTDPPVSGVNATNLAYVIYTSGSTGKPKGVEMGHGGLLNLLWWHRRTYNVTAADRATHLAGFAFDASVWEIWPYLTAGASLYLPDADTRMTPDLLRDWLMANRITLSFVPTPMAEQLLLLAWPQRTELRAILTGGDKLHRYPTGSLPFALINHYGPTENTVVATAGQVPTATGHELTNPAIGRPIANVQVYLLDRHGRPVPVDVPGELHIGGDGLALGYRNRPELTAERFIANPFSADPAARLYKTGDLARYLPDGNIEFLGRIDEQVKIRGFRIELGEIEAILAAHEAVREVVVIAREDAPGDRRLAAYVVAAADGELSVGELRRYLQAKVPAYMVPASLLLLDALPMTQNGKVDRRALPMPTDVAQGADYASDAAPRTAIEARLAGIWSEVLRVARVGVHDNFFALGGDSILAIQVISRAAEGGLKLTPRQLFEHQTVAQLAAVAGTVGAATAEQGPVTGPVSLTPIQHWFFAQRLPEPHHWNQAVLLETQALDPAMLERSLAHLLAHHDALRTRCVLTAAGIELVQDPVGDHVPFTIVDLSQVPDAQLGAMVTAAANELQTSPSLADGRLMCVAYFDCGTARPGRLLLIIHHLVVDGVSWRILLDDLQRLYRQMLSGEPVRLPAKTTSFQEWSRRLTEHARVDTLRQEQQHWLADDRTRALPLPVDHSRGENTEATARTLEVALTAAETGALLRDVPEAYATQIGDVLLTALVRTFSRWTGERRLLVDLEGHGREDLFEGVDLSRTVGWFSSQFPVLLDGTPAASPGDALKAVKEQLRTVPNKGIGYGLLRYLSGEPELGRELISLPQAEVRFNYLGQFDQALPSDSIFQLARESAGQSFSLAGERSHLFDINCRIVQDELRVAWTFSECRHDRSTVEKLVQAYLQALRELIAHSKSPDAGGYVPSDFPTARLSQAALDRVLGKVRGR